jgi:hypothetical protein
VDDEEITLVELDYSTVELEFLLFELIDVLVPQPATIVIIKHNNNFFLI